MQSKKKKMRTNLAILSTKIDPYQEVSMKESGKEATSRPDILGGNVKLMEKSVSYDVEKLVRKSRRIIFSKNDRTARMSRLLKRQG
jgi:hypothetical protein